jgi:hypothetical protein
MLHCLVAGLNILHLPIKPHAAYSKQLAHPMLYYNRSFEFYSGHVHELLS